MNEEIDTTVRGVDDASGQFLTGSTNLAEAAQSLAEGATDQAASVEEMQATINLLIHFSYACQQISKCSCIYFLTLCINRKITL